MTKTTLNIYNLLQECKVESDVEEKYKRVMSYHFPEAKISSPYYTDGLLENGVKMLMEFKYNLDLSRRLPLIELLIQLIYYLKQFELHGDELPSIIFGGDVNECFCLHSNDLLEYLNEDLDWSIAASTAASKNPDLAKKLSDDQNIKPFIFSINNDHFDFKFVVDKIKQLHEGTVQKVRITELNINRFFSYFKDRIIKQKKKYSAEDLVSIFLNCLIDSTNNYAHPNKKNCLVTSYVGEMTINRSLYNSFFDHFETNYSIEEKKHLTSICDRLVEDEARRFRGEFFTPTEWVLEAHKMIEEQFGLNWKNEYVVWDPAWGTGNLTRDFKFKELYCSEINYGYLETGKYYNPEAVKFQYDFLNDDVIPDLMIPIEDSKKIPGGLNQVFYPKKDNDGKELRKNLLFYFNPPFGTASNFDFSGNNKDSISKTKINYEMLFYEKLGKSAEQLYTQFLHRIIKFKRTTRIEISLAFFSPTLFLTGSSFKKFREIFLNEFCFEKGFVFCSKYFTNTASSWSVMFSLWSPRKNTNKFIVEVKDFNEDGIIETIGTKELYNTDNYLAANKWAKEKIIGIKRYDYPHLSNPLSVKEHGGGTWCDNAIGYLCNASNNVMCNTKQVSLFSSADTLFHGFPFINQNFYEVISLFTARKTITSNWINQKDEYIAPNEQHLEYPQWNIDAIIYSLFNGSSNQSSLRKITYKEKIWDIKNEWFWMPNSQMLQLANENGFDELYHDANGDHDRFVFNKILESSFSGDASDVLNKAIELVIKTFPYRQQLHEEHPEWHLHTWDAGWYQIKLILKKYFKDDLKEFNLLYKKFEDRMREGVYKFGFLKE